MANVNRAELLELVEAYAPEVAEALVNDLLGSGILEPPPPKDEYPSRRQGDSSVVLTPEHIFQLYDQIRRYQGTIRRNERIRVSVDRHDHLILEADDSRDYYRGREENLNFYDSKVAIKPI